MAAADRGHAGRAFGKLGVAKPTEFQETLLPQLNVLGRYSFTVSVPAAGALRPLREPDESELEEDDAGEE